MAKFVKGQSGNPGGAKKLPEDIKHLLDATGIQVKRDICECYNTHLDTIMGLATRQDIPAGLAMIASCMVNAIQTGDNRIMATFLDRIIGKPKETLDISSEGNGLTVVVKDYTKK